MLRKGLHLVISAGPLGRVEACIARMRRVTAIAWLAAVALGLISGGNLFAANVPPGFTETVISGPWTNAVGVAFENTGRMYVWEGTGQVWFKDPGDANYTLLLDIHDEVGKWGDHGMLGFALDPNFESTVTSTCCTSWTATIFFIPGIPITTQMRMNITQRRSGG